jgi:hypothetical protein
MISYRVVYRPKDGKYNLTEHRKTTVSLSLDVKMGVGFFAKQKNRPLGFFLTSKKKCRVFWHIVPKLQKFPFIREESGAPSPHDTVVMEFSPKSI